MFDPYNNDVPNSQLNPVESAERYRIQTGD